MFRWFHFQTRIVLRQTWRKSDVSTRDGVHVSDIQDDGGSGRGWGWPSPLPSVQRRHSTWRQAEQPSVWIYISTWEFGGQRIFWTCWSVRRSAETFERSILISHDIKCAIAFVIYIVPVYKIYKKWEIKQYFSISIWTKFITSCLQWNQYLFGCCEDLCHFSL